MKFFCLGVWFGFFLVGGWGGGGVGLGFFSEKGNISPPDHC